MSASAASEYSTPDHPGRAPSQEPNEGNEAERQVTSAGLESAAQPQNAIPSQTDSTGSAPPKSTREEAHDVPRPQTGELSNVPAAMDRQDAPSEKGAAPSEQMGALSIAPDASEQKSVSDASITPPPPPAKDEPYVNRTSTAELTEKELPDVPNAHGKKDSDKGRGKDDDSQPEIQTIMGQFADTIHGGAPEQVMSPRMELAEQFLGAQGHFPPRKSSLDTQQSSKPGSIPSPSLEKQPATIANNIHRHSTAEDFSLTRRSSTSTVPPPPEPEPDQPFDFHRFLEQLRHRTADPVAKFLRSFLHEFGKRQWMVHEQVKIISDFLAFITNKMAVCEIWREVSDSEFDNAKEGMEKLVMNRLCSQTFSPSIPSPPSIPRSASRSKRREMERLHGPWRKGQHQEDVERDEVLAQKMRIYSWIREEHLDIAPLSSSGRRFLNLAQQGGCQLHLMNLF